MGKALHFEIAFRCMYRNMLVIVKAKHQTQSMCSKVILDQSIIYFKYVMFCLLFRCGKVLPVVAVYRQTVSASTRSHNR